MSLKGQYVKDSRGVTGMIESEEPDAFGMVIVYYGTLDRNPVRAERLVDSLEPIEPPLNARVKGEIPKDDLIPPPEGAGAAA